MFSGITTIWNQIKITLNNFKQPLRAAQELQRNSKEIFTEGKAGVANAVSTIIALTWAVTGIFGSPVIPLVIVAIAVAASTVTNVAKIVMTATPLGDFSDSDDSLDEAALFMWVMTIQAFASATVAVSPMSIIALTVAQFAVLCLLTTGMWSLLVDNLRNGNIMKVAQMVISCSVSVAAVTFLLVPTSAPIIVAAIGILGIPLLFVVIADAIVKVVNHNQNKNIGAMA